MPSPESFPIALVGLRGVGKTTVGRLLARELGRRFVDLDEETVRVASENGLARRGSSAGELLARQGLQIFRDQERRALRACLDESIPSRAFVLATGGGVVEERDNLELLRERAFTVWLQVPPEVLAARVEADSALRPALVPGDALAEARALGERREPGYRAVAKLELPCESLSPAEVAARVAERWRAETSRP
jgi:shikimate kinase